MAEFKPSLERSASLLSAVLDGAGDLIAVFDMECCFMAFNEALQQEFKRIFGTRPEIGMNLLDKLAHAEPEQAKILELSDRARSGEEFTVMVECDDGRRAPSYYEKRISPIRDSHGRQTGVLQIIRDVTTSRRAEQVIHAESERERLEAILNCMTEGIVIVEPSGKIVLANPAALSLHECSSLGEAKRSLECWPEIFEARHPDGRLMDTTEWIARALCGETLIDTEILVRNRRNGKSFIGSYSASPVRNENGETILIAITIRDITERRRIEEALRESEERGRLAMQTAQMYAYEWNPVTDEIRRSHNCAEIIGFTGDRESGAASLQRVHPDDREHLSRTVASLTPANDTYVSQYRMIRDDGHVSNVHGSGRAFFDANGRVTRLIGMVADVSARVQAESALQESEERFRNMADTAPVMICVSDPDKQATFFNKRWLTFTGSTMEQELGAGWTAGVHPDDVDQCLAEYSASFDARRECHIEYRLRRADGEYRSLLCHGVPRFEPGGAFAGYVASCVDITDLNRTHEEALARQKLESVGVLAGGIAHDFNNLLGSVVADAELALANISSGASAIEEIQGIKNVALRAAEIVRELMIYAGQENATLEPVDISQVVGEMLELVKVSISKHAVLKTDLAPGLPKLHGNAAQIRQVLINLVTNASEAGGELDGVIHVTTARAVLPQGEYVRLEVSDSASGMTMETQARIFEPFFTTKFAGRGLGLAVVAGIVRSHGGFIHLESQPSRGTKFQIFFPCSAQQAEKEPSQPAAAPVERANGAVTTVLMVEDEDAIRFTVSKMLRKRGFSVLEAADGGAAIDLLRTHQGKVGVILLDMTIPGASSREVFNEARRLGRDMKIILTTAYSREIATASLDWPVEGFIRKPYQINDLVRLLEEVQTN